MLVGIARKLVKAVGKRSIEDLRRRKKRNVAVGANLQVLELHVSMCTCLKDNVDISKHFDLRVGRFLAYVIASRCLLVDWQINHT